jgi:putative endopeptidase
MKRILAFFLLLSGTAFAQGFDLTQLDRTADPCTDFYQFACGGWQAKNPLPADKARYNRYEEMGVANQEKLRAILEAAAKPGAKRSAVEREVGDYYAACIDEAAAEKKKAQPIAVYMDRIAAVKNGEQLIRMVAELNANGIPALFGFSPASDLHDARRVVAEVDQGGLSLPDRDYYLATDPKAVERRQKFVEYVAVMFELLGESKEQSAADSKSILELETHLAKASMDRTARRDPANLDHTMTTAQFDQLAPQFHLADYAKAAGAPKFTAMNVASPDFFKQVSLDLTTLPLEQWKLYLRWKTLRRMAPMLSADFVQQDFNFNQKYMRGTKAMEPRWKRCVRSVDSQLGEASGHIFVDRYFGPEGKQKIREIVDNVMGQLERSIREAEWMSPQTKDKALVKLKKISTAKLGFPEKYRDYSSITIKPDDFAGNYMRTSRFDAQYEANKIGKPVDKTQWDMTPPTVNAYYDPQKAEIVFPAGILQPPMFDLKADDAYGYGAIGRVAGHELTHGFDDEGRKFDSDGNLVDWWQPADQKEFEERAGCIADQYSHYSPVDDGNGKPLYLNGKLTLGENVADNGGLRMAYAAYMKAHAGEEAKTMDGFTPAQRVFLGYAISRCENVTPEMSRLLVVTDPHSPGKFRLIGPVVNMPEFQEAFSCKQGQAMVPLKRCKVW